MSERITSVELDTATSGDGSTSGLKFSGFTYDPSEGPLDARITKLTGLEAPSLNVTGGTSSFGGSVFTGVTLGDREVVLTVQPAGLSNKQIKNRLNSLITRSTRSHLVFRARTMQEDYTKSSLWANAYISGVSSPIFEKDDTIQITLKMAKPYLERPPLIQTRQAAPGLPVRPIPISLLRNSYYGGVHTFDFSVPLPIVGIDSMNADSPFSVRINIDKRICYRWEGAMIRDMDLNKILVDFDPVYTGRHLSGDGWWLEYNAKGRSVTAGSAITMMRNREYSVMIDPGWPELSPGFEGFQISLDFDKEVTIDFNEIMTIEQLVVWPRMLGM